MREKQRLAAAGQDDLDESGSEAKEAKAKLNDALKDIEVLRRKVTSSKEDSKLESLDELIRLKADLATAEDVNRTHSTEIRRLREENVELGSKLAAALQANQVALAEAEMAKAQASNVVAEGQEQTRLWFRPQIAFKIWTRSWLASKASLLFTRRRKLKPGKRSCASLRVWKAPT